MFFAFLRTLLSLSDVILTLDHKGDVRISNIFEKTKFLLLNLTNSKLCVTHVIHILTS